MCLMVMSEKGFDNLTDEMLNDIFAYNPDGFGFAFYSHERSKLVTYKGLFKNKEIKALIRSMPSDRPVYLHWRKATSGQVNYETCHPYHVNDDLIMFHNGVLSEFEPKISTTSNNGKRGSKRSSGKSNAGPTAEQAMEQAVENPNSKRKTKSKKAKNKKSTTDNSSHKYKIGKSKTNDTMNFISDFVKPSLKLDPYIYVDEVFKTRTENVIGSKNKLVFMDSEGNHTIYNEHQWVEYHGMLFSNDYSWPYWEYIYGDYGISKYDYFNVEGEDDMLFDWVSNVDRLADLYFMTYDEIRVACKNNPEAITTILYYEVLNNDPLTC